MRHLVAAAVLALVLAAGFNLPAQALDCGKATAPEDKAICADPQAAAADDAMVKAYQALFAKMAPGERKTLLDSQREWLKTRGRACADKAGAAESRCLKEETEKRRKYLAGEPGAGPGSGGKLVPVMIEKPVRKGAYALDVTAVKYAPATTPAEKLFNAEVDKLLKAVPPAKDEELEPDLNYSYMLNVAVTYASPQFISAHVETYIFSGGAHGSGTSSNINIDAAKGRLLTFKDVFASEAEGKILAECMTQILDQKHDRMPDEKIEGDDLKQLRSSVEEGLRGLSKWSFAPGTASIDYDAYALGAYAEGAYSCELHSDFLRPLLKAGFTLP